MNTTMSLTTAFSQFGTASYNLGATVYHSYRAASRFLKVPIGIALSLGSAAIIAYIARIAFRQIQAAWASPPPKIQHKHYYHCLRQVPNPLPENEQKDLPDAERISSPAPLPLPENVAKERNEALSRLLNLLDKYLIDPWIVKNQTLLEKGKGIDPLFDVMITDQEGLKKYLRVAALWHLSIGWEYGEKKYLEKELPSPPTLDSIRLEVQALSLEIELERNLLKIITAENEKDKVLNFQKAVNESSLTNGAKLRALSLSIKLDNVLKQPDQIDQSEEKAKLQSDFAFGMNNYLANCLTHTSLFIEDVMKARRKASDQTGDREGSTTKIALNIPNENIHQPEQEQEKDVLSRIKFIRTNVDEVVNTLSKELSTRYTGPLYKKEKSKISQNIDNYNQEKASVNEYLMRTLSEEAFLSSDQAKILSTSELTSLFFIKMLSLIEDRNEFKDFTLRLPKSLLDHVKPSIVNLIDKSMGMIENLDMEKTVVNFFLFLDQIFDCCEVVQKAQQQKPEERDMNDERKAFQEALAAGQIQEAKTFTDLYSPITLDDVQGTDIIDNLGDNAHPNVYAQNPHLAEKEWLEEKVRTIKLLLRNTAVDYDGQWLSKLLKEKGGDAGQGFIQLVLRANETIKTYSPLLGKVIDFIILGAQAFIENEGINAVQEAIHNISKPGKLSSLICVSVIKSYLDTYKEDEQKDSKNPQEKKEDLTFIQTICAFLSDEEKQKIQKHLEYIYKGDNKANGTQQLLGNITHDQSVTNILDQEAKYNQALKAIQKAHLELDKNAQQNQKPIKELQKAYEAIETERGLSQFERSRVLIEHVAQHELKKIIPSWDGGCVIAIIVAVIKGAFNLLKYQKVVKHLIFKVIDLVFDELNGSQIPEKKESTQSQQLQSIFEIAEKTNHIFWDNGSFNELSLATRTQQRIFNFMDTCNNKGWGVQWALGKAASISTNWLPNYSVGGYSTNPGTTVWNQLKKAQKKQIQGESEPKVLNERARITSKDVSEKVAKMIFALGKDPNRLSAEIIEKLSEIRNPNHLENDPPTHPLTPPSKMEDVD